MTLRLLPAAALAFAAACVPPEGPDTVGGEPTPAPDGETPSSTATIGPDGGRLALPDGTAFVVPPGLLEEETEITLQPTDRDAQRYEEWGWVPIYTAFEVEPALAAPDGDPLVVELDVASLPEGADPTAVVLIVTGDGKLEGWDADGARTGWTGTTSVVRDVSEADDESIRFDVATAASSLFQPMLRARVDDSADEERSVGPLGPASMGTLSCSAIVDQVMGAGTAPADIDTVVDLTLPLTLRDEARCEWGKQPDAAAQAAFEQAVDRFHARSCLTTYRAARYYEFEMGFFLPSQPIPLDLKWEDSPDCNLGEADATGLVMFFVGGECTLDPHPGWLPPAGAEVGGWNTSAPSLLGHTDDVEFTVAHELFHYIQDWSNSVGNAFSVPGAWEEMWFDEGGAEAAAEELVDDVPGQPYNLKELWQTSAWDDGGTAPYTMHAYWRFLEWTKEVDPLARDQHVLRQIYDLVPIGGGMQEAYLDQVIDAVFPSKPNYDRRKALADFAAAWLLTHDFEREDPTQPGSVADRFVDLNNRLLPEDTPGTMWGTSDWLPASSAIDTWVATNGVTIQPLVRSDLPDGEFQIGVDPGVARIFRIDLTNIPFNAGDPEYWIYAIADDASFPGTFRPDVAVRLYRQPAAPARAVRLWELDQLSTDYTNQSGVSVSAQTAASEVLYLVVTNLEETAEVDVEVTVCDPP